MMRKVKNMLWNRLPDTDKSYLRSAFERYKALRLDSPENFNTWLLKRGICMSVTKNEEILH